MSPAKSCELGPINLSKIRQKISAEPLLKFIGPLLNELPKLEIYLVGGAVRDLLLGRSGTKDYDLLARGVPLEILIKQLQKRGQINLVGRNFGVIKFVPRGTHPKIPLTLHCRVRKSLARLVGGATSPSRVIIAYQLSRI
jgi:tRNA nucleotidyltransferase/poly(A) polymerase